MSEPKSPVEQAVELFVYAPVGLALAAAEELPKLVEKGRQRVTGQITLARMMGQFAVAEGQKRGEALIKEATERLSQPRPAPSPARPPATPSTPKSPPERATATVAASVEPAVSEVVTAPAASANGSAAGKRADLAIPGYDALSASQVVQRLAGLATDELEAVRAYESAHRGRKTILGRISQLQSEG
jgi:hypothetical protein